MNLFLFARKYSWVSWLLAIPFVFAIAVPLAYDQFRGDVLRNWRVTEWHVEGDDVVLSGWITKRWNCAFRPPHRATDNEGNVYAVVSGSPTAAFNWPADGRPRNFGPWRVYGGAGKVLTFYSEHDCGPWSLPAISLLGTLDTNNPHGKQP